jgi:hypothetical protein
MCVEGGSERGALIMVWKVGMVCGWFGDGGVRDRAVLWLASGVEDGV